MHTFHTVSQLAFHKKGFPIIFAVDFQFNDEHDLGIELTEVVSTCGAINNHFSDDSLHLRVYLSVKLCNTDIA